MAIPVTIKNSLGSWVGKSRLHLSWLPEDQKIQESDSTMSIQADPLEKYATIAYTWAESGEPHTGHMLLCGSEKSGVLTAGWADSWHQSGEAMAMKGAGMAEGPAQVSGTYGDGQGGPDWGWRIEFHQLDQGEFLFKMVNIDPEGNEEWAVEARYSRVE